MNLNAVITQLRQRAGIFQNRVAGAAKFQVLPEGANLLVPAAYVIPLDENPDPNKSTNGHRQTVEDSFAVVVVLSNAVDERGQAAVTTVHDMRKILVRALVGWQPGDDYDQIEYDGGSLLHLDRARLYYQFEFKAVYDIGYEDTFKSVRDDELPYLEGLDVTVDAIDPADPNHPKQDHPDDPSAYPGGSPGPDGRAESGLTIDLPQP
ncbi:hypothetical protein CURE108131_23170 [Cupriavidus respiraculi]|uniref:Bacteriophage protein n=1 Tax=Cupriavidus respiraculi TaxID=195930 RepID=A0ABN7YJ86_9BURK|nr:hypothetical protein [Cupriavidus respiraculi]CAG9172401.1 hypothetical protein LMG21510_01962 [Cupriavidus respiraculi]